MTRFARFQSAVPNRHGRFPGVFAIANGLARQGRLTTEDYRRWRDANDHMTAAYAPPTDTDPDCYDRATYPGAMAWFKTASAQHLLEPVRFYLDLLDAYHCPWVELRTDHPGHIHFEDDVQAIATPWTYPQDWPLP